MGTPEGTGLFLESETGSMRWIPCKGDGLLLALNMEEANFQGLESSLRAESALSQNRTSVIQGQGSEFCQHPQ